MSVGTVSVGDFGPLVVETDIDEAVIDQLVIWLPTYLTQTERERGVTLPRPTEANYRNALDVDEFGDRQIPAVIVTTAKTQGTPSRRPDGVWSAMFDVTISSIVRGTNGQETRRRAALFGGAVKRALMQQGTSGDSILQKVLWRGSDLAPVADPSGKGRYLAASIGQFEVAVNDAVCDLRGPTVPDAETYVPLAIVTEVDTTVDAVGPTEPFGGS